MRSGFPRRRECYEGQTRPRRRRRSARRTIGGKDTPEMQLPPRLLTQRTSCPQPPRHCSGSGCGNSSEHGSFFVPAAIASRSKAATSTVGIARAAATSSSTSSIEGRWPPRLELPSAGSVGADLRFGAVC